MSDALLGLLTLIGFVFAMAILIAIIYALLVALADSL